MTCMLCYQTLVVKRPCIVMCRRKEVHGEGHRVQN